MHINVYVHAYIFGTFPANHAREKKFTEKKWRQTKLRSNLLQTTAAALPAPPPRTHTSSHASFLPANSAPLSLHMGEGKGGVEEREDGERGVEAFGNEEEGGEGIVLNSGETEGVLAQVPGGEGGGVGVIDVFALQGLVDATKKNRFGNQISFLLALCNKALFMLFMLGLFVRKSCI